MKYQGKPVVIDAVKWNGTNETFLEAFRRGKRTWYNSDHGAVILETANGPVRAEVGDWIIVEPDGRGRFYPCKDDVFQAKYEPVGSP